MQAQTCGGTAWLISSNLLPKPSGAVIMKHLLYDSMLVRMVTSFMWFASLR